MYCNSNDVKDIYHFVLVCGFYTELRKSYIKKNFYVRPSMAKCINLLNTLYLRFKKLGKYVHECFNKRDNFTIRSK